MDRIEAEAWAERTTLTNLETGERREGNILRVRYREVGTRRWTKFYVVPDPGQSVDELLARAPEEWARGHQRVTTR